MWILFQQAAGWRLPLLSAALHPLASLTPCALCAPLYTYPCLSLARSLAGTYVRMYVSTSSSSSSAAVAVAVAVLCCVLSFSIVRTYVRLYVCIYMYRWIGELVVCCATGVSEWVYEWDRQSERGSDAATPLPLLNYPQFTFTPCRGSLPAQYVCPLLPRNFCSSTRRVAVCTQHCEVEKEIRWTGKLSLAVLFLEPSENSHLFVETCTSVFYSPAN